jgi:hypothetical protein
MIPRTPKIRLLRDKRRALDDQIVKVEAELSKLKEEAREFEIAERVLLSLGGDDEDDSQDLSAKETSAVAHALAGDVSPPLVLNGSPATAYVSRKPPGVPSTPEMIILALKELTSPMGASKTKAPFDIMEFIKGRWWPSVTSKDISPVVWRMANEKRLLKDDTGGYGLPSLVAAAVGKGG